MENNFLKEETGRSESTGESVFGLCIKENGAAAALLKRRLKAA